MFGTNAVGDNNKLTNCMLPFEGLAHMATVAFYRDLCVPQSLFRLAAGRAAMQL